MLDAETQTMGMNMEGAGWVYVFSNKSMPDLVKVGFTLGSPKKRAKELDGTGLPNPFRWEYGVKVPKPQEVEQEIHKRLKNFRERAEREFFYCPLFQTIEVIKEVIGKNFITEHYEEIEDEVILAQRKLVRVICQPVTKKQQKRERLELIAKRAQAKVVRQEEKAKREKALEHRRVRWEKEAREIARQKADIALPLVMFFILISLGTWLIVVFVNTKIPTIEPHRLAAINDWTMYLLTHPVWGWSFLIAPFFGFFILPVILAWLVERRGIRREVEKNLTNKKPTPEEAQNDQLWESWYLFDQAANAHDQAFIEYDQAVDSYEEAKSSFNRIKKLKPIFFQLNLSTAEERNPMKNTEVLKDAARRLRVATDRVNGAAEYERKAHDRFIGLL
ncbi:MAG: GIY-YIG nuclease family protein [Nitrospira sp.]|nr:GIY-YIG nuclease family protein [Nitrospira sp.]